VTTIYGLENCESCRKARKWLERHGIEHRFIDYRAERVPPETLRAWARQAGGFAPMVNRNGTTWRNLPAPRREAASDPEWTLLLREHPQLVRRPVLVLADGSMHQGFSNKLYTRLFAR
jgi:Spx/MgsR family transcriptional regulator